MANLDLAITLRGLNLLLVQDINAVKIRKDGYAAVKTQDNTVVCYGQTGIKFDEDLYLPDIQLFIRMLKQFYSNTIEIRKDRGQLVLQADGITWRYRLGDDEVISEVPMEKLQLLESMLAHTFTLTIEQLKKITTVQGVMKARYIYFTAPENRLKVTVGEHNTYSASLDLEQTATFPTEGLRVPADRFIEVISKIDEPKATLRFSFEPKSVVCVSISDFNWMLGAVLNAPTGFNA